MFRIISYLTIVFILVVNVYQIDAQSPILNKKISINVQEKNLDEVLDVISKKGKFYFSYNSEIIDKSKVISLNESDLSIGQLIDKLFDGKIEAIASGKYIILKPKSKEEKKKDEPKEEIKTPEEKTKYTITGYIVNSRTGERLSNASIYQIGQTNSVLTNLDGYYTLTVSTKNDNLGLAFSRKDFQDTVIVIQPANHSINMRLNPKEKLPEKLVKKDINSLETNYDSVPKFEELPVVKFAVKKKLFNLTENLEFLELQHFQISLLPHVGTNRLMSGNVENNISLNILGGYSYAVNGVELGCILNIVRDDVKWVQLSGIGNVVGGNTHGVQAAGIFNNNRKSVTGVQLAGVANVVHDTINGVQAAGFANILRGKMKGAQLAGFVNVSTENVDGMQASGFVNFARKDVQFAQLSGFVNYGNNVGGLQAAGFVNVGKDVGGAQLAGYVNYSRGKVGGVQAAGFVNVAEEVNSAQVAGFVNIARKKITGVQAATLNIAKKVDGVQVGVFNFADSVSGASIGLFSVAKKGMHKLEISYDENSFLNATVKLGGNHHYYNILTGGKNSDDDAIWRAGYGFGTEFRTKKRFYSSLNLMGSYIFEGFNEDSGTLNLHIKFEPNFGWRIFRSSAIAIAPSLNLFVSDWTDTEGNHLSTFAPYSQFEKVNGKNKVWGWLGCSAIIRF